MPQLLIHRGLAKKKFFKGSLDDLSLVQHNTTIPISMDEILLIIKENLDISRLLNL